MRYLRLLVAVVLMVAAGVSTASALETTKILPEPTEKSPISGTGTAGKVVFETVGGARFECEKATGTGEFTTPNDGKGEAKVVGCKSLGFNCNSPGAKAGEVVLKDEIHYWAALVGGKSVAVAVALITKTLVIECPLLGVTMEKRGCTAGEVPPSELNKKIKTLTGTLKQTKGKQEITKILPPESKAEITCISEISKNGGAFEAIGQEGEGTTENFKQNGKAIEPELMH